MTTLPLSGRVVQNASSHASSLEVGKIENEPPPPTVKFRAATPGDAALIAAVHVASWRESYAGLLPDQMLRDLSISHRTERWLQVLTHKTNSTGTSAFVAELDGAVIGFASGREQRDRVLLSQGFTGEISSIYVLSSAQGRGIGTRLMALVARALRDQQHETASLWVLKENLAARSFYARLGGEVVGVREDRREAITLSELAYGWRALSKLAAR